MEEETPSVCQRQEKREERKKEVRRRRGSRKEGREKGGIMEMGAEMEGEERERDGGRKRGGDGPRDKALEVWAASLPEPIPEEGTRICLSTVPKSALPPCCPTEQQIGTCAHS